MKFLLIIMLTIGILSCHNPCSEGHSVINTDTAFAYWNKATLNSLKSSVSRRVLTMNKEDTTLINLYKNRIDAFVVSNKIENENNVDTGSIRFNFLKDVIGKGNCKPDFYLIEANRSGERVEMRNYIIYPNAKDDVTVHKYYYSNRHWIKVSEYSNVNIKLADNLKAYLTQYGMGINPDDVVITRFGKEGTIDAAYYLYSTLSNAGNIDRLFSLK